MTNCSVEVSIDQGFRFRRCLRAGVVERDGKLFCRQHDPEAVKARLAVRDAKWEAKNRQRAAAWTREHDCAAACADVPDPQPGELGRLRRENAELRARLGEGIEPA